MKKLLQAYRLRKRTYKELDDIIFRGPSKKDPHRVLTLFRRLDKINTYIWI